MELLQRLYQELNSNLQIRDGLILFQRNLELAKEGIFGVRSLIYLHCLGAEVKETIAAWNDRKVLLSSPNDPDSGHKVERHPKILPYRDDSANWFIL